jgi:hypothetical protein
MRSMTDEGQLDAAVDPHPTGSAGHLLPREKEEPASAKIGRCCYGYRVPVSRGGAFAHQRWNLRKVKIYQNSDIR